MKFYNRESELAMLEKNYAQSEQRAQMVVVTGRRRIGKTRLALHYIKDKPHCYLFVSKKTESLLCQEFISEIKQSLSIPVIGEINTFKDIFALLLDVSQQKKFVLVIDEFQEFFNINASIYSDVQKIWDRQSATSKCQVIFMGSIYSLMHKIFKDAKEPLFGRADRTLHLHPFSIKEIENILHDNGQKLANVLFDYYCFTGGVPKYIDMLIAQQAFTESSIIDTIFSTGSPFLDEGKNVLIEEFGKEYGVYFSILELLAMGKNRRHEIESLLEKNIGGYLERLESDYSVIKKFKPINAKPGTKQQKYIIKDQFLQFWFRFIYRYKTAIETANFDFIKRVLQQEISSYKGRVLETFFYDKFSQTHVYNRLGSYWEKNGLNEIDLVAINDLDKKMVISEVKLNKRKIDLSILKAKSEKLIASFQNYDIQYRGLSPEDVNK